MRKFFSVSAIFLIGVTIVTLFSTVCVAQVDVSNIQVTLKSQNQGQDPAFGGSKAMITITVNKVGDLVYIEDYINIDGSGNQKIFTSGRYEQNMTGYIASFNINRPTTKRGQNWQTINATVRLDGVTIYKTPISTSGTYKSFTGRAVWLNNSVVDIGKGRPVIQKKDSLDTTGGATVVQTSDTGNAVNNGTKTTVPMMSPTLDVPVVIAILFSVFICFRFSNRKNRK